MKKVYSSIDIGSDSIKFVVGEHYNNKINILASYSEKSKGIKKGLIVNETQVVNSIKEGIKKINSMLEIAIEKVIVNVPSDNAKFIYVTGSTDITNEEGIIISDDVSKVIKNSVYNKLPSDYELVTVVPLEFILDNNKVVNSPVGKNSKTLALKGLMVAVPKENVLTVVKVIEEAGLKITDITLSGLADYYEVRNKNLENKVGAIINIGHEITTISVINNGKFVNTDIIKLGGLNIEKDLSYIYGVKSEDARIIKEKFASANKRFCQISEVYEVTNQKGEKLKLNQLEVSEVCMNRLEEILNYAKKGIINLAKQNISYLIITGGVTEMKSFKHLVFEILSKDVIIYTTSTLGVRNNKYTVALGMIKYFIDKMEIRGKEVTMISSTDEEKLLTPSKNLKKDNMIFTKIFGSFIAGKEEKNE